jgi:hypothetical protein
MTGGICDKPHVIEVDVLPDAEAVDYNAVYLCGGRYYKYEIGGDTETWKFNDSFVGTGAINYETIDESIEEKMEDESNLLLIKIDDSYGLLDAGEYYLTPLYVPSSGGLYIERTLKDTTQSGPFYTSENGVATNGSEIVHGNTFEVIHTGIFSEWLNANATLISGGGGWTEYRHVSGTKTITENGTYPVAEFESVDVQVSGGGSGAATYVFNEALVQSGSFAAYDAIDDVPDDVLKTGVNVNITSLPSIPEFNEVIKEQSLPAFIFPVNIGQLFGVYLVTINESGKCEPFLIAGDNTKGGGGIENKLTGMTVELIDHGDYREWFEANATPVGGACDKPHVIEVDTLPTENIDENAVYLCEGNYYTYAVPRFSDVVIWLGAAWAGYVEFLLSLGVPSEQVSTITIPTKTTEGILESDLENSITHFYYIEDEGNVFVFMQGQWVAMNEMDGTPYGGVIYDISEATDQSKYYALFDGGWTFHPPVKGSLLIEENGEYDVTNVKTAKVDLYIPKVNSSTLNIEGVPAGGARSWNETEYYKYFSIRSLPVQDIVATLGAAEKVYTADQGFVLKSVTVPAVDLSTTKIPCGISMETYPKTEYISGEYLNTTGGTFKVYYFNGETAVIDLKPAHVSGFSAINRSPGKHILRVIYTEGDYTCYATYQITVNEQ